MRQVFGMLFGWTAGLVSALPVGSPWNRLIGALVLAVIMCASFIVIGVFVEKVKGAEYRALTNASGPRIANLVVYRLTFPGTVLHEFAHATFAFLTGAKVNKIQCFSVKKNTLGYVEYTMRGRKVQMALQSAATSCAPVVAGVAALILLAGKFAGTDVLWVKALTGYLMICVFNHMNMSSVDVKGYAKGLPVWFELICALNYVGLLVYNVSQAA